MAIDFKHQTAAQFAARFRARYRVASGAEAARLANWILNHIAAGDFTDAQVRNAFGLTTQQYTNLKTRMQALSTNWSAVQAAQGE
jgi:hypothetical protein